MKITSPKFDHRELEELQATLASGWVTQGPQAQRFEEAVAAFHGVGHGLATTSCTAALHLATLALGLGPGDEVVVPAFTWITSANCAEYVGAKAVFADVSAETFNLNPEALEAAINERTRAVVAVHLFGLAADMDAIGAIAARHGLAIIEDAACAIGTRYKGRPIGGMGAVGCFSFHPRKVVTTGEGGMVTTNRDDLADVVRSLRNHGSTGLPPEIRQHQRPYHMATFDRLGYNLRLSDIQAAVGVAQMEKLPALLAERRSLAEGYIGLLADIEELTMPSTDPGHTYQSFVVRVVKGGREIRNRIMDTLAADGIETRPGTHAVHRLGYYRNKYGIAAEEFPVAAQCEDLTITLPMFPGMTPADQERIRHGILQGLGYSS